MSIGLLILWLVLHALWRCLDQTPIRGDQTFYANGAIHIQQIWRLSWLQFFRGLDDVTSTGIRPPVASLLLAPWLSLFNNNLSLAGLGAVVWHACTFLTVFWLGRRLFDSLTGLFAAVYFLCLPLIYDVYIDPEFYFITLLPLTLLACTHLWDETRLRSLAWLAVGLIASFALLAKWVFAVYLLGPIIFLGVDLVRRSQADPRPRKFLSLFGNLFLMIFPVFLAAFFWYWPNRQELLGAFHEISEIRRFTPFQEGWTWAVLWHYPRNWLLQNKLIPLLFIVPGIILPLIPSQILQRMRLHPYSQKERKGFFFLLSSVLGAWIYFSIRFDNVPLKYIFALQPILAVLASAWIRMLPLRLARSCLYSLLLLFGFFSAIWMHFIPLSWLGTSKLPRTLDVNPNNFALKYAIPIPQPPQTEKWPQNKIAEAIENLEKENAISLDQDDSWRPELILPDLYYFDWRSCGVALNLRGSNLEASPLPDQNSLMRLALARYVVTSRGQVSRFAFAHSDSMTKNAAALNRLIDNAPQPFWNNFRLVKQWDMPYGLPTLQLFRRVKPMDDDEALLWCEFWAAHHTGQPQTWEQIAKIWAMRRNPDRMNRAKTIQRYLQRMRNADRNKNINASSLLDPIKKDPDLQTYEMLELGEEFLPLCAESDSFCAWKAAWMLGDILMKKNRLDEARTYLLKAWRLQREHPQILQSLVKLAKTANRPAQDALFQQLAGLTADLMSNNRRPILYQNAANLLLQAGWDYDALWYSFQGFVAGFNRYPNTKPLHLALQKLNLSMPNYETLPLPIDRWSEHVDLSQEKTIRLQKSQSYVFSFLNLDGGVYRLRWRHQMKTPHIQLSFSLDENHLNTQTYTAADEPDEGRFIFQSPLWGDRLRIECLEGEALLSSIQLQRIEAEIPFIDFFGDINVIGKNFQIIKIDPTEGLNLRAEKEWIRLNFSMHSDPRAWNYLQIESSGLETQSAIFTFIVRKNGKTDEEFQFSHPLIHDSGRKYALIPLPDELKQYPFMLALRIQCNDLPPADRRIIKSITLKQDREQHHHYGASVPIDAHD
ncbi:MAG: glycosyltransferase family 39 protein [Candidatus Omnitrophica bacterium]|nr:glycosyltransferase family 39 protein [Candidatus Omnitrophota bacterium]